MGTVTGSHITKCPGQLPNRMSVKRFLAEITFENGQELTELQKTKNDEGSNKEFGARGLARIIGSRNL